MTRYKLRDYQINSVKATVNHFRKKNVPAVIVLPTGSGKSLVISEIAKIAKGKILVLAHVKELVEQNHQKYCSYGLDAGIYSAGLSKKETSQQVTFGSVQSIAKNLHDFSYAFSLVVIDECHRVSNDTNSEYQKIIRHLSSQNPNLKVLGLTATPYRMDQGWIYRIHRPSNEIRWISSENSTDEKPPFFHECIFELNLITMIQRGYLTPVKIIDAPIAQYDFNLFESPELVIKQQKRATALITTQIIEMARERNGVMIFAATVAHAKEIYQYLPVESSAIVLGDMSNRARDSVIHAFKNRQIKFLVNVSVLTTGFDAPHIDLIAILRPTESLGLYQQIVGRGLRLFPGKENCLILDYAGNTYNIYNPNISTPKPNSTSSPVQIKCPVCDHLNHFWGQVDDNGHIIEHYGRRCQGLVEHEGQEQQCFYRYKFKLCPECQQENDIAARCCHECQTILVDPDDKLKEALKLKDAMVIRCSGMDFKINDKAPSKLEITYFDEDGAELKEFFVLETSAQKQVFQRKFMRHHLIDPNQTPKSLSPSKLIPLQHLFRHPDFVIARNIKRYWVIKEKVFDYEGRYRKAYEEF